MHMPLRALLATVSLVVLGLALGVGGDRLWLAHRPHGPTVVLDTEHARRFRELLSDMELSDEQRVAIDSILDHHQANVERTWDSLQPVLQATMDSARRAIQALFDADQLATFQEWLAVEHQRMHGAEHPGFPH